MNIIKCTMGLFLVSLGFHTQAHDTQHSQTIMSLQSNDKVLTNTGGRPNNKPQQLPQWVAHDHLKEHGGQIYSATRIKTAWENFKNQNRWGNQFDGWLGTDEQKIAFKLHTTTVKSEQTDWDAAVLYRHAISNFWDVQAGIKYAEHEDQNTMGAVLGMHGMAAYFFETDLELYTSDQKISLSIETERDIVVTQKWIAQPYIEMDWIIDQKDKGKRSNLQGLAEFKVGLQNRYEISKHIMPFVDIAYHYETQDQQHTQEGLSYGVGLKFLF